MEGKTLLYLALWSFIIGLVVALVIWGVTSVIGAGSDQERKRWAGIAGALVALLVLVSGLN